MAGQGCLLTAALKSDARKLTAITMTESYKDTILRLIRSTPFEIDTEIEMSGNPPTLATSEFLTNKEQGDWAERIILQAINEQHDEYRAIPYGRSDSLSAGDPRFREFYAEYQEELNSIGKKPDILIYRRSDLPANQGYDLDDIAFVQKAIAAIEVRSSSFLSQSYAAFMQARTTRAETECSRIQRAILQEPYSSVLLERRPHIHAMIKNATAGAFRELSFRQPSWSSTPQPRELTDLLRSLKGQMRVLQSRDYLSVTPKLEDLALVNRWVQTFDVRHYYLQVFFDKAFIISLKDILEITANPRNEGEIFSVERDTKNQGKTTIKIDIKIGKEILGRIDMPSHQSVLKELARGRLLFYVTFEGGKGYLDTTIFTDEVING